MGADRSEGVTPLHEHTTKTAAAAFDEAEVALLPTGSTEQHGPHLPLGTDTITAEAVARGIDGAVVCPTVAVGVSAHHMQFHGTLSVSPETFEAYVTEIVESLAAHGVRRVVAVNGHGGNEDALSRAARTVRDEQTAFLAPWNWFSELDGLPEELFGVEGIAHADAIETSMIRYLAEALVRDDEIAAAEAGAPDSWGERVHGANVGFDTADFSESGAVGTPSAGSREAGERLYERATEELAALVEWLADQPFDALTPEPHR